MRYIKMTIAYTLRIKAGNIKAAEEKVQDLFPDIGQIEAIEGVVVTQADLKMKTSGFTGGVK